MRGKVTYCIHYIYCVLAKCQVLKIQTPILALQLPTVDSASHSCIPSRPSGVVLGSRPSISPGMTKVAYIFSSLVSDSSVTFMKEAEKNGDFLSNLPYFLSHRSQNHSISWSLIFFIDDYKINSFVDWL